MRRLRAFLTLVMGSILLPGCDVNTVTVVAEVDAVQVAPFAASVEEGSTVQLTAIPEDDRGRTLRGRPVDWVSSDNSRATVNNSGLVTGRGAGVVTIEARISGRVGSARVTVRPAPVATVQVVPDSVDVHVGDTVQLRAVVRDANGNELSGRAVTWSSSNPSRATVSSAGVVTGLDLGMVTITARSEGQSGTGSVRVFRFVVDPPPPPPGGTPPVITESFFAWRSVGDGCAEEFRGGRTQHGFRFTHPEGLTDLRNEAVEAQVRAGSPSGATNWSVYGFDLEWNFSGTASSGTAVRTSRTCWDFGPDDEWLWIEERVRIRSTDGVWSSWFVQRLQLSDRPSSSPVAGAKVDERDPVGFAGKDSEVRMSPARP